MTEAIPNIEGLHRLGDPREDTDRVEIGPQTPYLAPIDRLNMLTQVRKSIDSNSLEELTDALIVGNDRPVIKLLQPITVGLFDKKKARPYLKRLNEVWGSNHSLRDLTPLTDDGDYFLIVIAGHRRTLAVQHAAEKIGIDKEMIDLEFHLQYGDDLTFRSAIQTQYRENFHKRPDTWEDAQAISSILEEGLRSGDYQTFADCARDLGVPEERVSRAFRFQTLPESTKDSVKDNVLQFGRAIILSDLFSVIAYKHIYDGLSKEEKNRLQGKIDQNKLYLTEVMEYVTDDKRVSLEATFASHTVKVSSLSNAASVQTYVRESIGDILRERQLELVQVTEEEMEREDQRRERISDRTLAIDSLRTIILVLRAEEERLKGGLRPAFDSKRARELLCTFQEGLERISHFDLPKDNIIALGENLIRTIEDSGKDDALDGFTQKTMEL